MKASNIKDTRAKQTRLEYFSRICAPPLPTKNGFANAGAEQRREKNEIMSNQLKNVLGRNTIFHYRHK